MAVKYFCDTCYHEVPRKSLLTRVSMPELEPEDAHTFNRSDIGNYIRGIEKDVCFACRASIIGCINGLGVKDATKV